MGVIRVLSESVINQIAAGEVIENPASLIKELVENSVDAGASKIVVEIWGGGLQRIKVSDNGCGMGEEDALLSLERHATSKIQEAEDLVLVGTMGFRGEALASIGSISRMTVQTALEGEMGTEVSIEGGGPVSKSYCARARGTTVEVRQLFYNVPARKKFQKSESQCASDVTKVMVSLSLAHPMIAFELYHQEKEMLKVVKESDDFLEALKRRVAAVLGEEFLEECTEIDVRGESLSFRGILGGAQNTRQNRSSQYQFVNERAVLCPAVSFAAMYSVL